MLVRVEMDQKRMTHLLYEIPFDGVRCLGVAAYLTTGTALGVLYFSSLWWTVRMFAGGRGAPTIIGAMIARFVLLGGVLALASLEGAMPLLLMAVGILAGRFIVAGRLKERES